MCARNYARLQGIRVINYSPTLPRNLSNGEKIGSRHMTTQDKVSLIR